MHQCGFLLLTSTFWYVFLLSLGICYHVFCHHAQQTGKKATPTGSALQWLYFKNGDVVPRLEVMAWKACEQANMHKVAQAYLDRVCLLCASWSHNKRRRVYRLLMLSTTVASPCQTLRELLVGDHELTHTIIAQPVDFHFICRFLIINPRYRKQSDWQIRTKNTCIQAL